MLNAPPALDPRTPFTRHTTPGSPLALATTDGEPLPAVAFRPDDAELAGYVLLDFDAFSWHEDDESIAGHPRDPFHRIDVRHSSAAITVDVSGTRLAETTRAEYSSTFPDSTQIHGLMCFFNERVDITMNGEPLDKPVTPWS